MGFERMLDILSKLQKQYPALQNRIKESEAVSRWEETVGPIIAKHAKAVRVQDGILWVEVEHPIWRSELHHRKRQILDRLNGPSPKKPLKDIFFLNPR